MARKQSSTIWFRDNPHHEIFFKGNYHDKMYKGANLIWEKLSTNFKRLDEPRFETVENVRDNYWAIISYRISSGREYGLAHLMDGTWYRLARIRQTGRTKCVLNVTSLGCTVTLFYESSSGASFANSVFRGHYYALNEDIDLKTYTVELKPLEELTDGDLLFGWYDEAVHLSPMLNANKASTTRMISFDTKYMNTYLTKRYRYEWQNVTWHDDEGSHSQYKWVRYDWQGNLISDPADKSENVPSEKTNTVRSVRTLSNYTALLYGVSGGVEETIDGDSLAMMVGALDYHNVGVNCTAPNVSANGLYYQRGLQSYERGETLQRIHHTALTNNQDSRLFAMAAGYRNGSLQETVRYRHDNLALYAIQSGAPIGYIQNDEYMESGTINPSSQVSPAPIGYSNYGLYYSHNGLAYMMASVGSIGGKGKLYRGRYSDISHRYNFIDWDEEFEYPYSFGGMIPSGEEDYVVISKSSNNYHSDTKVVLNSYGNVVDIPIYYLD